MEAVCNLVVFVPPLGWCKLNMDVAMDKVNGRMGYVARISNSTGEVMTVGVDQGVFTDDVDIPEVEGVHFSVRLASKTSLSPLVMKLDSLLVTQFVLGKCHIRKELF